MYVVVLINILSAGKCRKLFLIFDTPISKFLLPVVPYLRLLYGLITMAQYSIGEALSHLLEKSKWKPRIMELRMRQEWEQMMGATIAKYTRDVSLKDKKLTIYTDVAALKQELMFGKEQLIDKINAYFEETAVTDIVVK